MTFLVQFIGHIKHLDRPLGFPEQVILSSVMAAEDRESLNPTINRLAGAMLTQSAMIPFKSLMETSGKEIDLEKRFIVPFSSISFIETKVYTLAGDTPILNEAGKFVTIDGEGKETQVKPS